MKATHLITLGVATLLGACSTTYAPKTDYNAQYSFDQVQSYNIVADKNLKNPLLSDINRARINTAISEELSEKGIEQVEQKNADVLVSYFVVTKDKVKVYSSYSSGYYRGYGYGGNVNHVHTKDYIEGTLVVDVIDNKTKQSVWRSTLVKPLSNYDSVAERDEAIKQVVASMFTTLPQQTKA